MVNTEYEISNYIYFCTKNDNYQELTNQLAQAEAELSAAMEGLRDARHEAEELRSYAEKNSAR